MKSRIVIDKLYSKFTVLLIHLDLHKRIEINERFSISGKPILDIRKGARLFIGSNVYLNSRNTGYHLNMHSPVKLFADRPSAEIHIGDNTRIHGSCIHAYRKISIGKNCLIAANCQIMDGSGHDLCLENPEQRIHTTGYSKEIVIGDNVWIGANSIILPGVIIGNGSVIAAGSIVNGIIPEKTLAGGNPAKIIRQIA